MFLLLPCYSESIAQQQPHIALDLKSGFELSIRNSKNIKIHNIDLNNLSANKEFSQRQLVFNPVLNLDTQNLSGSQPRSSSGNSNISISNQTLLPGSSASVNLQYSRNAADNVLTNRKIELNQPLLSGRSFEASRNQLLSLDMQLKRSKINQYVSYEDLLFEFCNKYIAYLEAKERLAQSIEALKRSERYLAALQDQLNTGRLPEIDVKQNLTSIKQAEFDLNEARYSFRQMSRTFAMLVDPDKMQSEVIILDFENALESISYNPSLFEMLIDYDKYNKKHALRLLDFETLNFSLRQAEDRYLDKLDLVLSHSEQSSQVSQMNDRRIAVVYQRNLNKDQQKLAVIQAKSEIEKLNLDVLYESREREFSFDQLIRDNLKGAFNLQSLQDQFSLAKELLATEETKLNMGRSARTELALAQQRLRDTEFSLISQKFNLKRLQLSLLYQVGLLRSRILGDKEELNN